MANEVVETTWPREAVYWGRYVALMERLRRLEVLSQKRWGEGVAAADEWSIDQLRWGVEALLAGFAEGDEDE